MSECCALRVKDIDFDQSLVFVRSGKGHKDRSTRLAGMGRAPVETTMIDSHVVKELRNSARSPLDMLRERAGR